MAKYTYFKPSGKYYTDGDGVDIPISGFPITRETLLQLNGGKLPGMSSRAADFIIVITDDEESFPRLIFPENSK